MPRIRQYADKYAMADLSAHIKGRMKACGITQEALAGKVELSQQSVSRLLGHPEDISVGLLRKICKIVELDQSVLINALACSNQKT